jgi:periplasmic protein TonB
MHTIYSRHSLQSFGMAVAFEAALLLGAALILAGVSTTKPTLSEAMPIVLADAEPAAKPEPKPKPPTPKVKPLTPPPQVVQPTPPPPPEVPVPEATVPTAFSEPAPPPPAPPPAANTGKVSAEYAAKVHAAVQAAHQYPLAAVVLRYSGRVRVEFHLRDGIPGTTKILVASGLGMIDRAALNAVQNARYPEPPQEMRGVDLIYQVWVEFTR